MKLSLDLKRPGRWTLLSTRVRVQASRDENTKNNKRWRCRVQPQNQEAWQVLLEMLRLIRRANPTRENAMAAEALSAVQAQTGFQKHIIIVSSLIITTADRLLTLMIDAWVRTQAEEAQIRVSEVCRRSPGCHSQVLRRQPCVNS